MTRDIASGGRTGLVWDDRFQLHLSPGDRPERPERHKAIVDQLRENGLLDRCKRIQARLATEEELASTHSQGHIQSIANTEDADRSENEFVYLDEDTFAVEKSYEIARLAVGGLIDLAVEVLNGDLKNGFACVRPSGHHAEQKTAMGFCLFNNVAICAQRLVEEHGVSRILIVDWDVHHGNGTQNIFYKSRNVLYFSIHKFLRYFYPGTGTLAEVGGGSAEGFNV
eukprot:389079_1